MIHSVVTSDRLPPTTNTMKLRCLKLALDAMLRTVTKIFNTLKAWSNKERLSAKWLSCTTPPLVNIYIKNVLFHKQRLQLCTLNAL
ncbi:CLUMA_CG019231, isoform A [Clunio marinus]|uniref:CLUMA_CG019231, isoform A n=1 Tax=Clunio marinus TaxID=568069 RepID=A0A1J1J0D5_9DIPT|nr:CLUMA_CG019231, isoform A [Clunio marinus]